MEKILKELEDAKDDLTLKIVKQCPVTFLREVKEGGTDIFIGSLTITPCIHGELMGPDGVDWENKKKREDENNNLKAGDPRILWCFGGKQWLTGSVRRLISIHRQITWRQVTIAKGL